MINSTVGLFGFFDVAKKDFGLERNKEDLGQTFGVWGMDHGFYMVLPFLGPSSFRDFIGKIGDQVFDPITYLDGEEWIGAAHFINVVNMTSLKMEDYETLKKSAIDPYVSMRNIYAQYREKKLSQ